jgi:hypothetical protein
MSEIRSVVLGTAGLGLFAIVALWLTITRAGVVGAHGDVLAAARVAMIAIAVQLLHFAEELATGFTVCFRSRSVSRRGRRRFS